MGYKARLNRTYTARLKRRLICQQEGHAWRNVESLSRFFRKQLRSGDLRPDDRFVYRHCALCGVSQKGIYRYTKKKGWQFKVIDR